MPVTGAWCSRKEWVSLLALQSHRDTFYTEINRELGLIQFENVLRDCFQSGCHEILINWKLFLLKDKV